MMQRLLLMAWLTFSIGSLGCSGDKDDAQSTQPRAGPTQPVPPEVLGSPEDAVKKQRRP